MNDASNTPYYYDITGDLHIGKSDAVDADVSAYGIPTSVRIEKKIWESEPKNLTIDVSVDMSQYASVPQQGSQ